MLDRPWLMNYAHPRLRRIALATIVTIVSAVTVNGSAPLGPAAITPKWTWGPTASAFSNATDVWSAPAIVPQLFDTNGDNKVDASDAPSVVFISGTITDGNGGYGTTCS